MFVEDNGIVLVFIKDDDVVDDGIDLFYKLRLDWLSLDWLRLDWLELNWFKLLHDGVWYTWSETSRRTNMPGMTNWIVRELRGEADHSQSPLDRSNVNVWPNLLHGIVASDNYVLWANLSEGTILVFSKERHLLAPFLKKAMHVAGITELNVINQDSWFAIVTIPVLRLVLVVDATSSCEVVSVVACLAYTSCSMDPQVEVLWITNKILNVCLGLRLLVDGLGSSKDRDRQD